MQLFLLPRCICKIYYSEDLKMTEKELLFCKNYAFISDGKAAAVSAGYSSILAKKTANKLLLREDIRKQINSFLKQQNEVDLRSEVINGLKRLAFNSNSDCLRLVFSNRDDVLNSLENMDLFQISEIKVPKENAIEIKFFDRFKALQILLQTAQDEASEYGVRDFIDALNQTADKDDE